MPEFMMWLAKILPNGNDANDRYFKGRVRSYCEALELSVIDARIAKLVAALNSAPCIRTIASCEGHGWPFITLAPYVSFKCPLGLASTFALKVQADLYSKQAELSYFWEITAHFDEHGELIYVLSVPGAGRVTRSGLDKDFTLLQTWIEPMLHFKGED